jgi:hypothetical protein
MDIRIIISIILFLFGSFGVWQYVKAIGTPGEWGIFDKIILTLICVGFIESLVWVL